MDEMSPEMANKKWSPGYLYILDYGDGKQFKIGITSNNPELRANQIKRGVGRLLPNPIDAKLVVSLEMETNPYYLEQLLHMQYWTSHVGGEWFELPEVDSLTQLVSYIKPFGILRYYDGWYEMFDDDFVAYVMNGIYPAKLSYHPGVRLRACNNKFNLTMVEDDLASLRRVEAQYRSTKKTYPETFNDFSLSVDYRSNSDQQKSLMQMWTEKLGGDSNV